MNKPMTLNTGTRNLGFEEQGWMEKEEVGEGRGGAFGSVQIPYALSEVKREPLCACGWMPMVVVNVVLMRPW